MPLEQEQFVRLVDDLWGDGRLGRADLAELTTFLDDSDADEHALGVYRHLAFERWQARFGERIESGSLDLLEETLKRLRLSRLKNGQAPPSEAHATPAHSEAYFSSVDDCVAIIAELLGRSQHSVDICVFTVTDDRLSDAIARAHKRDVAIRIITDDDKAGDLGSDIDRLASLGIKTRQDRTDRHMHHKFAIFDQQILLNGSYNWTRGAADRNLENFIVTSDARLLRSFSREFERLWDLIDH
ncbi:endonuclease [bacterium]|nr:endonuclease [bacterium]